MKHVLRTIQDFFLWVVVLSLLLAFYAYNAFKKDDLVKVAHSDDQLCKFPHEDEVLEESESGTAFFVNCSGFIE